MRRLSAALFLVGSLAQVAPADLVILHDGRILDGVDARREGDTVFIVYPSGEIELPLELVREALLDGAAEEEWEPTTEEEREKFEAGFVPFDGGWVRKSTRRARIEKLVRERREAAEIDREQSVWGSRHIESTKHFDFESTVPGHVFQRYRDLMEAYFADFKKEWRVKQPRSLGRLKVCFYRDRKAFHQTSGAPSNVLGYFRFVEPLELDIYYDRLDEPRTEEVMFHEANHYLQKLIDPGFKYPHFPGESLAEYYGASTFDSETGELQIGLILEGRLTEVHQDILKGKFMGLEEMVTDPDMYQHYTWGWSFVHYLMGSSKYEKKFKKWYVDLAKGKHIKRTKDARNLDQVEPKEIWRSLKKALGLKQEKDVKRLEQAWHEYVENELNVTSTHGLENAAEAARKVGRKLRARRLFGEADASGEMRSVSWYRFGELLADLKEYENATDALQRAVDLDPLEVSYRIALAQALMDWYEAPAGDEEGGFDALLAEDTGVVSAKDSAKDEAQQHLRLAKDIDPGNYWLSRNFKKYMAK